MSEHGEMCYDLGGIPVGRWCSSCKTAGACKHPAETIIKRYKQALENAGSDLGGVTPGNAHTAIKKIRDRITEVLKESK